MGVYCRSSQQSLPDRNAVFVSIRFTPVYGVYIKGGRYLYIALPFVLS
jgi:hypothetical protein